VLPAAFPVVLGGISNVTSLDELGGKIRLSRSVPSLPQSLDSALRPGDEAEVPQISALLNQHFFTNILFIEYFSVESARVCITRLVLRKENVPSVSGNENSNLPKQ